MFSIANMVVRQNRHHAVFLFSLAQFATSIKPLEFNGNSLDTETEEKTESCKRKEKLGIKTKREYSGHVPSAAKVWETSFCQLTGSAHPHVSERE